LFIFNELTAESFAQALFRHTLDVLCWTSDVCWILEVVAPQMALFDPAERPVAEAAAAFASHNPFLPEWIEV
jgi:hypothetical protein